MRLSPGTRLRSTTDTTEIVVVTASQDGVDLRCGGYPMVLLSSEGSQTGPPDPQHARGTQVGKRYGLPAHGIEVLCTKAGVGSLSVGDEPLSPKAAKPLPSSD